MPTIYLVRHGEYDNPRNILPGRLPVELSAKGVRQAEWLHGYFADKQIGTIYSSAVERCKQTASIIADGTLPIVYDQRLLETFSPYQGYWGDNRHTQGYHFFSHRSDLGGESLEDIRRRMADFWDEYIAGATENVIICSHGDPLYLLYCHLNSLPTPVESKPFGSPETYLRKGGFMELALADGIIQQTTLHGPSE